jgi:hypothetical protein
VRAIEALPQNTRLGEDPTGEVGTEPADRLEADTEKAVVTDNGQWILPGVHTTGCHERRHTRLRHPINNCLTWVTPQYSCPI